MRAERAPAPRWATWRSTLRASCGWATTPTRATCCKIDPATGQTLQTITLTAAFGTPYTYNYLGLQVLPAAMTLGATGVPAGCLLVFNGYPNTDRVIAVNPATGAIIASLSLAGNYDLTAGVYDASSGHLFVTAHNLAGGNRLVEIDPANGAEIATAATPLNIQTWAGLAIDPVTGNLWIGSSQGNEHRRSHARRRRSAPHQPGRSGHQPERDLRAGLRPRRQPVGRLHSGTGVQGGS